MQEEIISKLEASRKELLDLGMRNTLLNYKISPARGLHIVQEKSTNIFDILVRSNKAMTFLGRPGKDEDEETIYELPELTEPELQDAYNDTKLQTNEKEQKLQTKILNTYYFARTSIEEQGVNILYLALGMLKWYEKVNTEEPRYAPLILIPVSLERSSASERFSLRYSGADIGTNLSLQAKMFAEFNITIPNLEEHNEIDVEGYFNDIKQRISHLSNWEVEEDVIELGFFSFGKFMIYHDLDATKWPEDRKPYDHEVIKALFTKGFDQEPLTIENQSLDKEPKISNLSMVMDADSSQAVAMLGVNEGRHMVIQGPPGTGKSQTIANIIADAIGKGKKILFVAEKMAALEVVKRRLDNIHLGIACLELHSHKANKKSVHEELKKVLDLGKPTLQHLENEIGMLTPLIEELNNYCDVINTEIQNSGHSPQEIIGNLLKIANDYKDYKFPKIQPEGFLSWSPSKIREAEILAEQVEARLSSIGEPEKLLFYGTELNLLIPSEVEVLKSKLEEIGQLDQEFQMLNKEISEHLFIDIPQNDIELQKSIDLLDLACKNPCILGFSVEDNAWGDERERITDAFKVGKRLSEIYGSYQNQFIAEAWNYDILPIRQNLIAHGSKWYKFLIGDYKRSVNQLAGLLTSPMPGSLEKKLEYVNVIMEAKRLSNDLESSKDLLSRLLGSHWKGKSTNWQEIETVANYLFTVYKGLQTNLVSDGFISYLKTNSSTDIVKDFQGKLLKLYKDRKENIELLLERIKFKGEFDTLKYEGQSLKLLEWRNRLPELHKVIQWNVLKENMEAQNAGYLIEASVNWSDAHSYLKIALQKSWYDQLLENILINSSELRKFERSSHEEIIAKFGHLDVLNQHYKRALIALKHFENLPKIDGGGQINVLRGEFNRKARHMPIRKLMTEAGLAIQAIKPVIMMSPMSIASFLPPDSINFDLVIFDEASQVRPVDALGAILRGKQVVVVGDTKQMPPTSFFDKLNTDIEEEDNVTADMLSILGMCDAQGACQTMLQWHYRSRHESLISLSNQEFYENKLVIFPSPGSKHRMGLFFHHLPDTYYDKGKTRANVKEAEYVADAVVEHAKKYPKQSLGVVAFSTSQMQAINTAMEIRRRLNPDIEDFFRNHSSEPFFVKNLENVQGDERDVIFISIGYGRTLEGNLTMNFGPLNNEGGERRLNVLITRAKSRCEVFTNITSEEINLGPNAKFGIRALKSFLYYAQYGKFEMDHQRIETVHRSFEELVSKSLEDRGYIVRQKVGTAGYYIDLAVVDPDHPGRYILGINCDGKSYASAKSARDRDRLRKEVLEAMGWKLHNVWSIDWFRNPQKELDLIINAIERSKAQLQQDDIIEEEMNQELEELVREAKKEDIIDEKVPLYQIAELPTDIAKMEMHLHSQGNLGKWISDIVFVEGPVHFDEMARRMAEANGISKIGSRVRASLEQATDYAQQVGLIEKRGEFLWHNEKKEVVVRDRSNLPGNSRKISYIAPEELYSGLEKIVKDAIAIQPENAVSLLVKLLGFSRLTEDLKKTLLITVQEAVGKGLLVQDNAFLKIKEV